MTSLDPSHFASLGVGSSNDRTHGGATHPARPEHLASPSSTEIDEDDTLPSPTSSFFDPKELPHRLSSLHLPDLRFEQGYLMSLMPFFHFRPTVPHEQPPQAPRNPRSSSEVSRQDEPVKGASDVSPAKTDDYYLGSNFYVEWKMVLYVTLRDQLFYPLIQGCLWGSASPIISHFWRLRAPRSPTARPISSEQPPGAILTKPATMWDRLITSV